MAYHVLNLLLEAKLKIILEQINLQLLTLSDIDIDIKPVNAKHFFQIAQKKDHKIYIWVPRVLNTDSTDCTDCTNKECTGSFSHVAKWCVNSTS